MGGAPASCNDPLKMPREWGCFWDDFAKDGDGWAMTDAVILLHTVALHAA